MVNETLKKLTDGAEKIRNTDPQNLATMEVGDEWRQGDCRVIRLADDFVKKHACELEPMKSVVVQLAPGNTQGSRHILRDTAGVKMFRLKNATPVDGPIFVTKSPNAITHPEHGHIIDLPSGCYAVPGQQAFADTLRRSAD